MNMQYSNKWHNNFYFIIIFVFLFIFSCGNNKISNGYYHYYGVFNDDFYYDDNSLFSNQDVKKTIENNNLDFWIFGLHKQGKKKLFSLIDRIASKNKNNKKYVFDYLPIVNKSFYPTNTSNTLSVFFNDGNTKSNKDKIYPIYRDLQASILYDTINVDYKNKLTYNIKKYFELLDKGYILAAITSCEITGPDWKLKSPIRTVLLSNKKSQTAFMEALKKRKTYITTNPQTKIIFKIGQNTIGDIINSAKKNLKFTVKVQNPVVRIRKIEILTNNNTVIFSQNSIYKNNYSVTQNYTNDNLFSYYFVRVELQNGDYAFTTPIWIIHNKKFVINNLSQGKILSVKNNKYTVIKYNIENISPKPIYNIEVVVKHNEEILSKTKVNLKIRESKQLSFDYNLSDSTGDELVRIIAETKAYQFISVIKINKNITSKNIAFDTSHFNVFSNMFSKAIETLNEQGYSARKLDNKEFVNDYSKLKRYDLFIITVPEKVYLLFDKNLDFLSTIQKYVYYGGRLIVVGFNSQKTQSTTVFLNEVLRVLYSPIKFRIKKSTELFPIFDEKSNYEGDSFVPVFSISNRINLQEFQSIGKIYFRDPVEIYGEVGGKEVSLKNISRVKILVYYNDSTHIKKRRIRNNKNYVAAGVYKFGKGKVCVLSGINFSDYDIDILENKEWFIELIDYLFK